MKKQLSVMEIERFAIHDGPGIRTTVFLQGCPLHCLWCANPESQTIGSKLMYDKEKCVGCGTCAGVCRNQTIEMKEGRPLIHRDKCRQCRRCESSCLQNAICFSGEKRTVESIMAEVLRDGDYYEESGGGVTVSGGEAFVQFEGFMELLRQCHKAGISTAVETCGHVSADRVKQALPWIDLFLFDLKHTDPEQFYRFTGGDLNLVLDNLKYLARKVPEKIIVRVPVIPGFNFDNESITGIFKEAASLGIKRVQLLPYHTLGIGKYEKLGMPYLLKSQESLKKEDLEPFRSMGQEKGLEIQIGGD